MTEEQKSISKKTIWLIAGSAIVLVIVAILIWSHGQGSQPTWLPVSASKFESDTTAMVRLTNEAMVRAGIVAQPVEMRNFSSIISAVGIMEIPDPAERTIAARARGRIEKMFVSATGMYVHKGESLFEFYSPDILSAETEYLIAAGVGDMDKNIMAQNPGMEHHSDPGLLKAAKERLLLYGLTSEQINRLEDNLKVSNTVTITAPIDGIILQKQSQEGAYVDEGASIYQLADLSMLWAEVEVPEADIRFIRMGQTIPIQAEAYPGAEFKGTVILISPIEDQASRTIRVRLAVPNPSGKLRPAMTFTTSVPIAAGNALAIPQSAVIRSGIADYVWVASDNNMFTRHSVTLGALSSDNYYQVLSGLSFGDRVAANGAFLIDAEHDLSQNNPMAGMNMGEAGNKNSGEGTGVVRSIDNERQKITLDHSTIPGVMPAMTMAYKVADPKFLHSVSTNESVRFTLTREVNGEYLITSIQKQ